MAIKVSGTEVISDDKRILNNESLPDIRPSLLLDFANSKTLDPRITFTRGSTATYYDGKTTAKAEENLLKYSQEFDNAAWGKSANVTATANSTTAPDGTTTADTLVENDTAANFYYFYQTVTKDSTAKSYTFSTYAKQGSRSWAMITIYDGTNGNRYWFDLATVATGATFTLGSGFSNISHSISDAGNGWCRLEINFTTLTGTSIINFVAPASADNTQTITGVVGQSAIYIWGAQLEQRDSATAYTPTTSSPIVKYQPVLQTAASGEARFDHDPVTGESKGLLIEEARTNLVTHSGDLNAATANTGYGWVFGSTLSSFFSYIPAQKIAPDGTQTGVEFVSTANTSQGLFLRTSGITFAAATYTASIWVYVPTQTGVNNWGMTIDLEDNESTTVDNVTSFDQWHRISLTVTNSAARSFMDFNIRYNSTVPDNDDFFKFYVWGAQVEEGSFPTSYIPTSGSTVTRAGDDVSITGSNFSSFFSNQAGTIYCEYGQIHEGNSVIGERLVTVYPSSNTTVKYNLEGYRAEVRYETAWDGVNFNNETRSGGKVAMAFDDTGFSAASLGVFQGSVTRQPYSPQSGRMYIGSASIYGHTNACIPKVAYYPKRLPNATLQAMTEA